MIQEHPNMVVLSKLDIHDLDSSAALFSADFIWHYFNPNLPEVEGDYVGVEGLKKFFAIIDETTDGTFKVEPISTTPIGDELMVVHARDRMEFKGNTIAIDVVIVWRIVDGRLKEGWDIPSAFTLAQ